MSYFIVLLRNMLPRTIPPQTRSSKACTWSLETAWNIHFFLLLLMVLIMCKVVLLSFNPCTIFWRCQNSWNTYIPTGYLYSFSSFQTWTLLRQQRQMWCDTASHYPSVSVAFMCIHLPQSLNTIHLWFCGEGHAILKQTKSKPKSLPRFCSQFLGAGYMKCKGSITMM